jgi:seryl-tRNA(Sec) selenium transferase
MVSYGAPVEQAIRLAGARVVPVGAATDARGMKVGKEAILGTIAALEAWEERDHAPSARPRPRTSNTGWRGSAAGQMSPRPSCPTLPTIRSTG